MILDEYQDLIVVNMVMLALGLLYVCAAWRRADSAERRYDAVIARLRVQLRLMNRKLERLGLDDYDEQQQQATTPFDSNVDGVDECYERFKAERDALLHKQRQKEAAASQLNRNHHRGLFEAPLDVSVSPRISAASSRGSSDALKQSVADDSSPLNSEVEVSKQAE
jgi:hypothetical protein